METMNVKAILSVVDKGFTSGMREAQNAVREFERETSGLDRVASTLGNVGTAMTVGLTVPVVAGVGASVKAFADFETAMRGVSKTTDLTGSEFEALSKEIQNMSMEMPVAATEIAGVAEAAGQLGIEKEHILSFTETMVKMGTATDLSSQEAAVALARLANITQMPQTEFENLGSTVVELGNNMAATESEIVNMGLRLAGAGTQVGLTEDQILALSASMASVGIQAEAGGTAMSSVLKKMDGAVRESGAELEGYAQISGMTAQEFATAWQNDPQTAIVAFIEGLGGMIASGEDANGALEALGITGIRETDTLLRLAQAGGLTGEAFDLASKAWEENTALSDEASEAWNTLASQAQILWNQIVVLAQEIGARLAPAISNLIDMASNLVTGFLELDEGTQNIILAFVGVIAAIGPLLIAVSTGIKAFQFFSTVSGLLSGSLTTAGVAAKVTAAVIGFLTSPIGLVVGAIVALIGILIYLYNTNETVRNAINVAWNFIKDTISSVVQAIVDFTRSIIDDWVQWYQDNQDSIQQATERVWNAIQTAIEIVMAVIVPHITNAWEAIKLVTGIVWEVIKSHVQVAMEAIQLIIGLVMDIINGDWESAWNRIKDFSIEVWTIITEAASNIWNLIKEFFLNLWTQVQEAWELAWETIRTFLTELWTSIQEKATEIWTAITEFLTEIWNSISEVAQPIFDGIRQFISDTWETINTVTTEVWNIIKSFLAGLFLAIVGLATGDFELVKEAVTSAWENIKASTSEIWESIKGYLSDTWENIKSSVSETWDNIKSTISDKWEDIKSDTSNAVDDMKQSIEDGFSRMVDTARQKGTDLVNEVKGAFNNAINKARQFPSKAVQVGRDLIGGFVSGVKEKATDLINSVKGVVGDAIQGAKNILGIRSPSRVFREIGIYTDEGFIEGVDKGAKGILNSVKSTFGGAVNLAENIVSGANLDYGIPTIDIAGSLARSNAQVESAIRYTFNDGATGKQPAFIHLSIGGQTYVAFVEDISREQAKRYELEKY